MKPWEMMKRFGPPSSGGGAAFSSLLHFEGANDSTVFTDESGKVWTAAGGAKIITSDSRFGSACGLFPGTGQIYTGASADLGFGAGDWTIEMWLKANSVGGNQCVWDNRGASSSGIAIYASLAASYGGPWGIAGDSSVLTAGPSALSTTAWKHVAVTRQGNTLRGFIDGVLEFTYPYSYPFATSSAVTIGANYLGSQAYNGRVDEQRVTKGVALYTANFTPPSAPFPNS